MEHVPDPYLELRKKFVRRLEKREARSNDLLAVKITNNHRDDVVRLSCRASHDSQPPARLRLPTM
jgi:hypothetical protein